MNTIQEQWEGFMIAVVPPDASKDQVLDMKKAFYAGAQSVLWLQFQMSEPTVSEEAAVNMLEGIHQECKAFLNHPTLG